jgi:hypothetical protein
MSTSQPACIFCGGTPVTEEHPWPKWLKKAMQRPSVPNSIYHAGHAIYGPAGQRGISERFRSQSGAISSHGLQVVCAKCNNEWMSDLQNQAKPLLVPLIRGKVPILTNEHHSILTTWAIMFTMVIEFADVGTIATSQKERFDFAQSPRPLDNWMVWIGRCTKWPFDFLHYSWSGRSEEKIIPIPTTKPDCPTSQSTTFSVGKLLFQTYSTTDPVLKVQPTVYAFRAGLYLLWPKPIVPYINSTTLGFLDQRRVLAIANSFINSINPDYLRILRQSISSSMSKKRAPSV